MLAPTKTIEMHQTRWLSVSGASAFLGVNQATLRHWADSGELRSYRTPGGHRRFSQEDLLALVGEDRILASPYELSDRALSRIRRRIVASPVAHSAWAHPFPEPEKEQLRSLGRRLLELASDYLTRTRGRAALLNEARAIGERYGAALACHGLALSQVLEGFIFFRNLLEEAAQGVQRREKPTPPQREEMHRLLAALLDQVLLGTVHGYEVTAGQPMASRAGLSGSSD